MVGFLHESDVGPSCVLRAPVRASCTYAAVFVHLSFLEMLTPSLNLKLKHTSFQQNFDCYAGTCAVLSLTGRLSARPSHTEPRSCPGSASKEGHAVGSHWQGPSHPLNAGAMWLLVRGLARSLRLKLQIELAGPDPPNTKAAHARPSAKILSHLGRWDRIFSHGRRPCSACPRPGGPPLSAHWQ